MYSVKRSEYFGRLEGSTKSRYLDKIALINNLDPYYIKSSFSDDVSKFPPITPEAIVWYFKHHISSYTLNDFNCEKSLHAENFVASDKVHGLICRRIGENYLLKTKVAPSMKTTDADRQPWVICSPIGAVLAAHCTCMAGLGEACSHIGAVVFTVMHLRDQYAITSVTDRAAYWKVPSKRQKVSMCELSKVDFSTPEKILHQKKTKETPAKKRKLSDCPVPADSEFLDAMAELRKVGVLAPFHIIKEPFASELVEEQKKGPQSLRCLYHVENEDKSLDELRAAAAQVTISVSEDDVVAIEEATRKQSKSKKWFDLTAGKVRASLLYKCCHTEIEKPAYSTIIQVCDPYSRRFSSRATRYGCKHEKDALEDYCKGMRRVHTGFSITSCGTFTHPDFPEFTATPDSIISCTCCGDGCVEVKCPICREGFDLPQIRQDLEKNNYSQYLEQTLCEKSGVMLYNLKQTHSYYYQVQAQMFLSGRDYCDFVMWTGPCFVKSREVRNELFWKQVSEKGRKFFNEVLLLELLGKWYSRQHKKELTKNYADGSLVCAGVKKKIKRKRKAKENIPKADTPPSTLGAPSNLPTCQPANLPCTPSTSRAPLKAVQVQPTSSPVLQPAVYGTPLKVSQGLPTSRAPLKAVQLQASPLHTIVLKSPLVGSKHTPSTPVRLIKICKADSKIAAAGKAFYQRLLLEPPSPK